MILVCGATGMFGGHVLHHLLQKAAPVRGLTSSASKVDKLRTLGAEAAMGNMDAPDSLAEALDGVERVFLVSPMDEHIETREKNMIAAAKAAGVKQVVKLFGAVRHRGDPLVTMHENAIEALKASGMSWTLVSPNTVIESNFLPQAPAVREAGMIFGAAGDGKIGMVALDDCALAAATVLTAEIDAHHGMNHEITGPVALTFADVAAEMSRVFGRPVAYQDMPVEDYGKMLVKEAGFNPETIETDVLCHMRAFRRGDADLVTDTFTQLTGKPSTTLAQFLGKHRAAFVG